jgi:hypothetical protein
VHTSFYVLLIAMPIVGYIANSAYGAPTPFFGVFELPPIVEKNEALSTPLFAIHRWVGWLLIIPGARRSITTSSAATTCCNGCCRARWAAPRWQDHTRPIRPPYAGASINPATAPLRCLHQTGLDINQRGLGSVVGRNHRILRSVPRGRENL